MWVRYRKTYTKSFDDSTKPSVEGKAEIFQKPYASIRNKNGDVLMISVDLCTKSGEKSPKRMVKNIYRNRRSKYLNKKQGPEIPFWNQEKSTKKIKTFR
jgi:hypothetical protein